MAESVFIASKGRALFWRVAKVIKLRIYAEQMEKANLDPFNPSATQARKLLCEAYWSAKGWGGRDLSVEEVAHCRREGYLFPPSGPALHTLLTEALASVTANRLAAGFVVSLKSRLPELRSALGSFGFMRDEYPDTWPNHEFVPSGHKSQSGIERCAVCRLYNPDAFAHFDVFSFERVKWGGVQHGNFMYACFDLWRFSRVEPLEPAAEDIDVFRSLIAALRAAEPTDTAPRLAKKMKAVFPSSVSQRVQMLEIFGHCGIIPDTDREFPSRSDMSTPAGYWRGSDGLDDTRLQEYFGEYL